MDLESGEHNEKFCQHAVPVHVSLGKQTRIYLLVQASSPTHSEGSITGNGNRACHSSEDSLI